MKYRKRLTIELRTLDPIDSHDVNFARERVEPVDDARKAKIFTR